MEEKICQKLQFLQKSEEEQAKALKAGGYKFNSLFTDSLCRYRLGETRSEYKCPNCQAIETLADMSGSLVDIPFNIRNKATSCFKKVMVVREKKMSLKAFETEVFNRWLLSNTLDNEGIPTVANLYHPFRCDSKLYFFEEYFEPFKFEASKENVENLLKQLIIYYIILASKGYYLVNADLLFDSNAAAYKFSGIKVRSSFTLGLNSIVLSQNKKDTLPLFIFNLNIRSWIEEYAYDFWLSLWPSMEIDKCKTAEEVKIKNYPLKELKEYANFYS